MIYSIYNRLKRAFGIIDVTKESFWNWIKILKEDYEIKTTIDKTHGIRTMIFYTHEYDMIGYIAIEKGKRIKEVEKEVNEMMEMLK